MPATHLSGLGAMSCPVATDPHNATPKLLWNARKWTLCPAQLAGYQVMLQFVSKGKKLRDDLQRALLPDERVLWSGEPYRGLIFRPIEAFLIPFSLLWAGFAVFWNFSVWSADQDAAALPFKLFGLPFLVVGLDVTFGRFFIDVWLRRRLQYAVTNRRILIYKKGGTATSKSVDIRHLPSIELSERSDGSGSIRFGQPASLFSGQNFGLWQPTFDATAQFLRIPNVRFVYELIHKQTER
jgi:hypothetical protein